MIDLREANKKRFETRSTTSTLDIYVQRNRFAETNTALVSLCTEFFSELEELKREAAVLGAVPRLLIADQTKCPAIKFENTKDYLAIQ